MSTKVVKATFDRAARDYDTIIVQIVPKYREIEKLVQGHLTFPRSRRLGILELGTGTGKWAARVLIAYPRAHYHGIDFSEQMLQIASRRLKRYADRVLLENLDLNLAMPAGEFDLIYSAFAIHHIRDKRSLFRELRNLLRPEGLLLYVDVTIASSPELEESFLENWKSFMRSSPWPNRKIKTIIDDHLENDIPETVEVQLQHLREAGFSRCDILWRHEKFAVFHARS